MAGDSIIPAYQIADDVVVIVSGTVQRFNADGLDEQWLGIDLSDDAFAGFDEDDAVLSANSVTPVVAN